MDRWNTRAWIFQEAFVSASNMIILFPRAKEMAVEGWGLVCQDLSFTEIGINLEILRSYIDGCGRFFNPKPGSSIPVKLPQWAETLERLSSFLPEAQPTHMFDFWIGGSKTRRTCNAAVAWSFLKHRDNDRVADKLAILANLCDYTLRLNTLELEKSQKPLSVCIFALAIANGDFSLLSPDSYHIPRGMRNSMWILCYVLIKAILLTLNSPVYQRRRLYMGPIRFQAATVSQSEQCRSRRAKFWPRFPRHIPGNKQRALTTGLSMEDRSLCRIAYNQRQVRGVLVSTVAFENEARGAVLGGDGKTLQPLPNVKDALAGDYTHSL